MLSPKTLDARGNDFSHGEIRQGYVFAFFGFFMTNMPAFPEYTEWNGYTVDVVVGMHTGCFGIPPLPAATGNDDAHAASH